MVIAFPLLPGAPVPFPMVTLYGGSAVATAIKKDVIRNHGPHLEITFLIFIANTPWRFRYLHACHYIDNPKDNLAALITSKTLIMPFPSISAAAAMNGAATSRPSDAL